MTIPVKFSDSFVVKNVSGGMAILFYVEKEKKSFIDYFFLTFNEKEVSTLTVFLLFFSFRDVRVHHRGQS